MKRFVIPVAILLLLCAAGTIYVATLRPFAPQSPARRDAGAAAQNVAPTLEPAKENSPSPQNANKSEPTSETPKPTVANGARATAIPSVQSTLVALSRRAATQQPSNLPLDARLTQTSIPAEKTLSAIEARAVATPKPRAGASATPRVIDQTTNILLLGSDLRPDDPKWEPNTDVMIVLFLDTANSRAALLSFPRDLVVAIPKHEAFRMNFAFHYGLKANGTLGGAEILKQVLRDEFNIRIDHWALVDFDGFQKIIDTLGGIDVHVPCALEDTIDQQHFVIPAGELHMDYLTAKRYVQSRYTTTDTSRNFRQQRVLWAILKKALQLNALDRVPVLWNQLHDSVQTNMSVLDIVGLVPAAYALDPKDHPERIHAQVLDFPAVYPWISTTGAWLYMPDYDEINKTLNNLFDAPSVARTTTTEEECPTPTAPPPPTRRPATPTPTSTSILAEPTAEVTP